MHQKILELKKNNLTFAIATITKTIGSVPREVGAKMLIVREKNDHTFYGTVGGGALEAAVIEDAKKLIASKSSSCKTYDLDTAEQVCGGKAEVFFEIETPAAQLYIFGAGHVGQALCRILQDSPFEIHLIDERAEWNERAQGVIHHSVMWDQFCHEIDWQNPYVVIMTHDHKYDNVILKYCLGKPSRYLGLMGSAHKWEQFKKELASVNNIDQVKCPIGNRTLGRGPTEIAVGIANELLLAHATNAEIN